MASNVDRVAPSRTGRTSHGGLSAHRLDRCTLRLRSFGSGFACTGVRYRAGSDRTVGGNGRRCVPTDADRCPVCNDAAFRAAAGASRSLTISSRQG